MSLDLDQMPSNIDMTRRDQWGRYLVVPPDGGKPVGYTRVTTVAGTLDSGGGLAPWKATMTVVGTMLRKGIRAQWEALVAESDGDPWYGSPRTKGAAKALVEEAAAVGGANDRRDIGTSMHTLTALIDSGRDMHSLVGLSEDTEGDLVAYVEGMAASGLTIEPGMVEVTVVLDDHKVAGTFDRLVRVPGIDLPVIADLKTGADLSYSWQSIAVQLAAYSRADAIYVQGAAKDGSQDVRSPMPDVDQTVGLVMHLDAGAGALRLYLVNLDLGWSAFGLSMATREWRKAEVAVPLDEYVEATTDDTLVDTLEASLEAVEAQPMIDVYQNVLEARRMLTERIKVIGAHEAARAALVAAWPVDVPFLHRATTHTDADLALIDKVLSDVEATHGLTDAAAEAIVKVIEAFPGTKIVDEVPY